MSAASMLSVAITMAYGAVTYGVWRLARTYSADARLCANLMAAIWIPCTAVWVVQKLGLVSEAFLPEAGQTLDFIVGLYFMFLWSRRPHWWALVLAFSFALQLTAHVIYDAHSTPATLDSLRLRLNTLNLLQLIVAVTGPRSADVVGLWHDLVGRIHARLSGGVVAVAALTKRQL